MRTWNISAAIFALVLSGGAVMGAQTQTSSGAAQQSAVLDRVVAVINGDVLLESDIQEEMHFAVLEPYLVDPARNTRLRAMQRLVNRTLILQQMKDQDPSSGEVDPKDIDQRVADMRKQLPMCSRYKCTTTEGWNHFLTTYGFTEAQVKERWHDRLMILKYIEARFRSGIRISPQEVETYFHEQLEPQFTKEHVKPPELDSVYSRVEEILLQQRVNGLMQDWVKSLWQQGSIEIVDPEFATLQERATANKDEED